MVAIALVVGFLVIFPAFENGYLYPDTGFRFAFIILSIILGIIFNAILIEVGHLIGAKIGKYEILSFNILGFCLYKIKKDGKSQTKFKFPRAFDGLTGDDYLSKK